MKGESLLTIDADEIRRRKTFSSKLRYIFKPYFRSMILILFLIMITKGIECLIPFYMGYLISEVVQLVKGTVSNEQLISNIWWFTGLFVLLSLVAFCSNIASMMLQVWVGSNTVNELKKTLFDYILKLPMQFFHDNQVGTLLNRTLHLTPRLELLSQSLITAVENALLTLFIGIGMLLTDWKLTLLVFSTLPFIAIIGVFLNSQLEKSYQTLWKVLAKLNSFLNEHLSFHTIIRIFGLQKRETKKFITINDKFTQVKLNNLANIAKFISGIDFLRDLILVIIFFYLFVFSQSDALSNTATFFVFIMYVLLLFRSVESFAGLFKNLPDSLSATKIVLALFNKTTEKELFSSGERDIEKIQSVTFENVWFSYDNENWVLQDISFHVVEGKTLGIVGPTGAGKTTLFNLLLRFYDPQKGKILINGHDIKEYRLTSLRKTFSLVLQESTLFSRSLFYNIGLGSKKVTKKSVGKVIDFLALRPFITSLPQGLNFQLKSGGGSLSEGEKQFISITRAISHDREILLLDEATAHLDYMSENILKNAVGLYLTSQTKIGLVIAHRTTTIKDVTNIIVIDEGKIIEQGTHQELIKKKGMYEKLYRLHLH